MSLLIEAAPATDPNNSWYVVSCRPWKEDYAIVALREGIGLTTYSPKVNRPSNGGTKPVAFFPGYIFVRANLKEVQLSSINSTPGVLRLLQFGEEPRAVPAEVVESVRQRVDKLNAEGGLPRYEFHPGDRVWLRTGPLRGLEAVFLGPMPAKARVKVLLEFLGRQNEVQVDVDALEATPSSLAPKRHRTTRGRGRRIKPSMRSEAQV